MAGTFRPPDLGVAGATAHLKRFFEKLDKATGAKIAYFAALERLHSGCGMPSINPCWHFLAAGTTLRGWRGRPVLSGSRSLEMLRSTPTIRLGPRPST